MNYLNSTIKWVKHKYYNVFVNMKFNLIIYNTIFFYVYLFKNILIFSMDCVSA